MREGVWSPLADTNPVPGDPWKVGELVDHFAEQSQNILDVVRDLKKVEADDVRAKYLDAIIDRRNEVIPNLKLLADRYENSANALRPYAGVLELAQDMAEKSKTDSWEAQQRVEAAQRALEAAGQPTQPTIQAVPGSMIPALVQPQITPGQPDHAEELRLAKLDLDRAENLLDEARERRDHAARKAIDLLDDANHDDLKNPSRGFFSPLTSTWDSIKNLPKNVVMLTAGTMLLPAKILMDPVGAVTGLAKWTVDSFSSLKTFGDHLGVICAALGVAGMIFPPFGAAMGTVMLGISVFKLGLDTYMAATGQGSWGDVAMGAIGLATMGAGRIAAQAQRTRALQDATREVAGLKALGSLDDVDKLQKVRKLKIVARLHKGDAVAEGFLPKMSSWGGAILRDPKAPADVVLKLSPSAQKLSGFTNVLDKYDKIDGALGKIGTIDTFAGLAEPILKEHLPNESAVE